MDNISTVSERHSATFNLVAKFPPAPEELTLENNRPVWTVHNRSLGNSHNELCEFYNALHDCFSNFVIDNNSISSEKQSIHDLIESSNLNIKISFKISFNISDYFFIDFDSFKKYYVNANNKFENFYIFENNTIFKNKNSSNESWNSFFTSYSSLTKLFEELNTVAHHAGVNEAIFIDPSENGHSIAISTDIKKIFSTDENIFNTSVNYGYISELVTNIGNQSIGYLKELAVFRSSLFEFFKSPSSADSTDSAEKSAVFFINNSNDLKIKYEKNYQAFVSGLTLEKLKTELASEQLKLSDTATKGLMDISGKMFALPAAIGLSRIGINAESIYGNFLIIVTSIILFLPLRSQLRQLRNIESANNITFNDLENKIKNIENDNIKNIIESDLTKIINNISETIKSVRWTLCFYIFLSVLPIIYICASDIFFEFIKMCFLNIKNWIISLSS